MLKDAIPVFAAFAAFAICYFLNIFLGISVNCIDKGERWDWARFFKSLWKIIVAVVVNAGLVLAAYIAKQYVPDIPSVLTDFITTATFGILYFKGYKEALVGIYDKVRSMFEISDKTDFTDNLSKLAEQTTFNTDDMRIAGSVENEYPNNKTGRG